MPFLVHVRFILEYIIPKIPEHDTFADNLFFWSRMQFTLH